MRELSCAHTSNAIAHLQTDSCVGVSGKILFVVVASVRGSAEHIKLTVATYSLVRMRKLIVAKQVHRQGSPPLTSHGEISRDSTDGSPARDTLCHWVASDNSIRRAGDHLVHDLARRVRNHGNRSRAFRSDSALE